MAKMAIDVESPVSLDGNAASPTMLDILNPTQEAFEHWGQKSVEYLNRRVIPNSHLRHQGNKKRAGLSLQDANLLKIEATHGVPLNVPVVGKLLANMMLPFYTDDVDKKLHLLSGRFPITSTATVRMQSEAWEGAIVEAKDKPYGELVASLDEIRQSFAPAEEEGDGQLSLNDALGRCDENGLSPSLAELVESGQVWLV